MNRSKQQKDNFSVIPVKGKRQEEYDLRRLWRIYLNAAMVGKVQHNSKHIQKEADKGVLTYRFPHPHPHPPPPVKSEHISTNNFELQITHQLQAAICTRYHALSSCQPSAVK